MRDQLVRLGCRRRAKATLAQPEVNLDEHVALFGGTDSTPFAPMRWISVVTDGADSTDRQHDLRSDLRIRPLLDHPGLRRAMGLDVPTIRATEVSPRLNVRRLLEDAA